MDPRIERTRRRLQEALFALARERGVGHIPVSDIAERAGVNRSTFYQHYSDKETLLADALDLVAAEAGASLNEIDAWSDHPPAVLVNFLAHVDDHAELYRRTFAEPGAGVALVRLRSHIDAAVRRLAPTDPEPPDVPVEIAAAGITGSIVGVIGAWLACDPRPGPEVAAKWIWMILTVPHPRPS